MPQKVYHQERTQHVRNWVGHKAGLGVLGRRNISFQYWDSNSGPSGPWPSRYTGSYM